MQDALEDSLLHAAFAEVTKLVSVKKCMSTDTDTDTDTDLYLYSVLQHKH